MIYTCKYKLEWIRPVLHFDLFVACNVSRKLNSFNSFSSSRYPVCIGIDLKSSEIPQITRLAEACRALIKIIIIYPSFSLFFTFIIPKPQ